MQKPTTGRLEEARNMRTTTITASISRKDVHTNQR